MNETVHLLRESELQVGGWGGQRAYSVQDWQTSDPDLSPVLGQGVLFYVRLLGVKRKELLYTIKLDQGQCILYSNDCTYNLLTQKVHLVLSYSLKPRPSSLNSN